MSQTDLLLQPTPPLMPNGGHSAFLRWLARTLLRTTGWKLVGTLPNVPKAVMIVAPHSSSWDGLWGFAAKIALNFEVRVLAKAQLFWWPLGPLLRRMGVTAVNREAAKGVAEQAAAMVRAADRLWFGLAPEGTRKPVPRFKAGFWKIAKGAGVPVLPVYFDYPRKVIGVGPLFEPGDDMQADIDRLQRWYAPWRGRNRDVAQPADPIA